MNLISKYHILGRHWCISSGREGYFRKNAVIFKELENKVKSCEIKNKSSVPTSRPSDLWSIAYLNEEECWWRRKTSATLWTHVQLFKALIDWLFSPAYLNAAALPQALCQTVTSPPARRTDGSSGWRKDSVDVFVLIAFVVDFFPETRSPTSSSPSRPKAGIQQRWNGCLKRTIPSVKKGAPGCYETTDQALSRRAVCPPSLCFPSSAQYCFFSLSPSCRFIYFEQQRTSSNHGCRSF